MKLYQLIAVLLTFIFGTSIAAAAMPPAPDPSSLAADWWTYFEPKESLDSAAFGERVAAIDSLLAEISTKPAITGQANYSKLATKIVNDLKLFNKLKYAPFPPDKLNVSTAQSYSIKEALQKHAFLENLNREINDEIEEQDWQKLIIVEEAKQQTRLRNQYLEVNKADPKRLGLGLELIADRIKIELKQLEFDRRKKILQQTKERAAQLESELDVIPERLQVFPSEVQDWQKEYDQAQEKLGQLHNESSQEQLSNFQDINTLQDPAVIKYLTLTNIKRDIDIGVVELLIMKAQLAINLTQFLSKSGDPTRESIKQLLAESISLQERLTQQRIRLRRVLEKMQDSSVLKFPEDSAKQADAKSKIDKIFAVTEAADKSLLKLSQEIEATKFMAGLLKKRKAANENWIMRTFDDTGQNVSQIGSKSVALFSLSLFEISETPVTTLGIIRVLLILIAAFWISKGLRRGIQKVGERRNAINQGSLYTLGRIVHYLVLTIGIIIGLSSIGIDFTKFALFASALGVGIGFGLQTLISNFVAGLIILFEKSIKVKDYVELESGVTGEVAEINMRSTLITTNDNIDIVVPNSEFVSGRVTNWTLREAYRRIRVPFGVAYGTDKDLVKTAVLEAATETKWTLMDSAVRHPQVWLVEFGDSSLNFELVVWLNQEAVKRPAAVNAAYLWKIDSKLAKYGIEIPFPQRDLHVRSVFGLKDAAAHSILPTKTKL